MPRIQRNPVTLMAGSSFTRSLQSTPQNPTRKVAPSLPVPTVQQVSNAVFGKKLSPAPRNPVTEFHKLFGEGNPVPQKVLTIDDVAPVAMPLCPHGIRLTKDEYIFETSYKGKPFQKRMFGVSYFLYPKSFECIDCHPVCVHGLSLTPEEIKSRARFSQDCPDCTGKFTNAAYLAVYLAKQKLTEGHGMSLTQGEFVTSYGLRITKAGANFAQAGGSREVDKVDTSGLANSTSQIGHGPTGEYGEDADYDGDKVDEDGDPISYFPSETQRAFESARAESTKDALDIVLYKIVPDKNSRDWIVTGNGTEVYRCDSYDGARKAVRELTEFDRLNFKSTRSKHAAKIEHKIEDTLTAPEVPSVPEKLAGMKEQKPNRKVWTVSEESDLQKEITDEIEKDYLPVRAEHIPSDAN